MSTRKKPADRRCGTATTLPPATPLRRPWFLFTLTPVCKAYHNLFIFAILIISCCLNAAVASAQSLIDNTQNVAIQVENDLSYGKHDAHTWQPASLYNPKPIRTFKVIPTNNTDALTGITLEDTSPEAVEKNLNTIGSSLLDVHKNKEAIRVLKLNVQLNPQSWSTHNSLGEAYARTGRKNLAIRHFKKSLKLNPDNENARQAIIKLKQKQRTSANKAH